ncbi:KTSC domain-containing protein [Streptomyces sp. NPDC000594]|uniref:KTSC domain-containing protein n=1 Tax=Streptomyces sp. NPDC000594 TaxID=3154261 RepID=UPI0033247CBC
MLRTSVVSSNLASVGYDPLSSTLEVQFTSGHIYQYAGVPESVFAGLMAAFSKGSYLDAHVKKAGYFCTKIG